MCIFVDKCSECFLTFAALVRFVSCVNVFVFDKLLSAMESFFAHVTLMSSFLTMLCYHVILQSSMTEGFLTYFASYSFVTHYSVLSQEGGTALKQSLDSRWMDG